MKFATKGPRGMLPRNSQLQNWPIRILAVYSLALITATHWPKMSLPHAFNFQDKFLHLACYTLLGFVAYWAFAAKGWLAIGSRSLLIVAIFASAFGAMDELTQFFAPGRVAELADWIADTCGGVLGAFTYAQVARIGLVQKLGVGGR